MTATIDSAIHPDTTMGALLDAFPGARRALFAKYHVGGCSSCGFQLGETLREVCARNEDMPVEEAIAHLLASQESDAALQISPPDLKAALDSENPPRLLDVRSREEFEAVRLPGADLMTQPLLQEFFHNGDKSRPVVVYCHQGLRSLDAAAYLIGHGFQNVKSLAGGIDAWSTQVDAGVPRYKLEME
ncbi:MAG: rhodanese-like domain-containing protein [Verrucomicrobiota bacterium]